MKKRKKRTAASGDEVARNRETLAEARRRIQTRVVPLAFGGMLIVRLFRDEPWIIVPYGVLLVGLVIRWTVGYRRLKGELGLAGEYDQLDENIGWGTRTFLVVFGGFAAFFVLLFLLMSALGKH